MEYSLDYGKTWTVCTGDITGLSPCTVLVRYAETESAEAGEFAVVTVYDRNATFKVTYEANGAPGGLVPTDSTEYIPTGAVTVLGNTGNLAKTDCAFIVWNTKADGTVSTYKVGDVFEITEDTTLYAQWILGALNREFTIGDGDKVHFSKASMYWDGNDFKFEDEQYEYASIWNTSHVSHFHWSKYADVACAASYSDPNRATSDVFFTNYTYNTAKSDFTVNGVTGKYRTLSQSEWSYLFNDRENAREKVGYATVCGVHGIIILPDSFTDPNKNNGSEAFVPQATTGWTAMENAGAVFLPATEFRSGTYVSTTNNLGGCWSSSPYLVLEKDTDNLYNAYNLLFSYGKSINPVVGYIRNGGRSVRLVCDVE